MSHPVAYNIIRKILAVFAGIFLAAIIIFAGVAITLNIKPLEITPYLKHLQPYLKVGENQIFIQKAVVAYKGSLQLYLDNVTLFTPEKAVLSEVKHVHAAFSNRSLAFGRIVVKHATLEGLDLQLEISDEGIEIATFKLKKKQKKQKPFDLVKLLNDNNAPALKYLKTLEINKSNIQVADLINGDIWLAKNTRGQLQKSLNRGTQFVLDTHIQRSGSDVSMPAIFEFRHLPESDYADIALDITKADSHLMVKYLPNKIKNLLTGEGVIKLGAKIVQNKGIIAPYFQIDLVKGAFAIDGIYSFPLTYDKFHFKGDYSRADGHKLTIQELTFQDEKGYILKGNGVISNIKNDPHLDLLLISKSMPLRHLLRYLPDGKIGSTTKWIQRNVHQAIGTDIRLAYTGPTSKFPCKEIGCGFDGSFDFTDLTLRFMDEVTPATDLAGHFIIRDGGIIIQSKKGQVSDQKVVDITVDISNLFEKGKEKVVTVVGKASGLIQGTLDRISEKVGNGWLGSSVGGTHVSDVKVTIPLKKKITFDDVDFTVSSDLEDVSYDVPVGKNKLNFNGKKSKISIKDKILKFNGKGDLAEVPVKATWEEDLRAPGAKTKVAINGVINDAKLNKLMQEFIPLESIGNTPFDLSLTKIKTDIYDYELKSNFKNNSLIIPILNWEKLDSNSMDVEARGRVEVNGDLFSIDSLAITGDDVEIAGSMYLDKKGKMSLILSPFKLGKTDITTTMDGEKILLNGKHLDISGFSILEGQETKSNEEKRDIIFEADIDVVNMQGGVLAPVKISAKRKGNKWQKFIFDATSTSGATIEVNLDKGIGGKRVFKARATNAGEALKTLGLYNNIYEGSLTLINQLDEGVSYNQSHGELKITRTRIKDFPILAKLLSLISLEQLFSSGKGIIFDDVVFPFTTVGDTISVHKAILEGPSIGMRFSGDIHTANTGNKLDIEGSLIPVQGLNKIVSKIPIVGHIITGSQDGVLVADFKVRGDYDDPDVSVNPLSVVTPGLLKDIFGAITGKKKKK